MEITDDNHCFVCGELNMSGLRMRPRIEAATQSASLRLAIPCAFKGWQGMAHGGILATLLDETCAYAAKSLVAQIEISGELYAEARAKMFDVTGEK